LKKFHRAIWMALLARAWEALLLTRGWSSDKAVSDDDVKRRPEAVAVGGNERVWIRQLLEMGVSAGV
jgi:hypothetical protein